MAQVAEVGFTLLVQEIVAFFRERNPALQVVEEGEWENITFRRPKRVAPAAATR